MKNNLFLLVDPITNNIVYATYAASSTLYLPVECNKDLYTVEYSGEVPVDFIPEVCYRWKVADGAIVLDNLTEEVYLKLRKESERCLALVALQTRIFEKQRRLTQHMLPLQSFLYEMKAKEATEYLALEEKIEDKERFPLLSGTSIAKEITFEQAATLILFVRSSTLVELARIEVERELCKTEIMK